MWFRDFPRKNTHREIFLGFQVQIYREKIYIFLHLNSLSRSSKRSIPSSLSSSSLVLLFNASFSNWNSHGCFLFGSNRIWTFNSTLNSWPQSPLKRIHICIYYFQTRYKISMIFSMYDNFFEILYRFFIQMTHAHNSDAKFIKSVRHSH